MESYGCVERCCVRTGKHSPAEPGVKQSSVDETDRLGSSSPLSGSLAVTLLPPSSVRVCVYLSSSFQTVSQRLWTGISQPINLILNTSRLRRQVRVRTREHTQRTHKHSWRNTRCNKYVWSGNAATRPGKCFHQQLGKQTANRGEFEDNRCQGALAKQGTHLFCMNSTIAMTHSILMWTHIFTHLWSTHTCNPCWKVLLVRFFSLTFI